MAVVRLLPGFGFVRDDGTGKVRILPGFGFVKDTAPPPGGTPVNPFNRASRLTYLRM